MYDKTSKFTMVFFNSKKYEEQSFPEIEKFWKECLQSKLKFNFEILKSRKRKHSFNYKEDEFELDVIVQLFNVRNNSQIETFVGEACKKWCLQSSKEECPQWMYVERNIAVPSKYKSKEENVVIYEFAFGSIPNASTFVSHYMFHEVSKRSSLLCTFYHSQQFFELFISSNHNKSCVSTESLIRKFEVYYDSITEIFINYSGQHAEMFLHLNYLPLLYAKKVLNLIPDSVKEGSNCLSAMCSWSDKWERVFKLGCNCIHSSCDSKRLGKSTILKLSMQDKFRFRALIECLAFRCPVAVKIYCANLETKSKLYIQKGFYKLQWNILKQSKNISLIDKFDCEYAWQSLHSKSSVICDQVHLLEESGNANYVKKMLNMILNCAHENPKAVVSALYIISDMVDKNLIFVKEINVAS